MDHHRQRWTQERRRKQPSLYDEYLNEERSAQREATPQRNPSAMRNVNANNAGTIRAVTPDNQSIAEEAVVQPTSTHSFERQYLSHVTPSSSPRTLKRERTSPRSIPPEILTRSDSTDGSKRDFNSSVSGGIYGHVRPRTRTLEEARTRERSPSSVIGKSRARIGSVHTATSPYTGSDGMSSVGHPSLVSPLSQASFGSSSVGDHPQRPVSPESSTAPLVAESNTSKRRTVHLMRTLCGRMSGNLYFRRGANNPWSSSYCYIHEDTGSLMYEPGVDTGFHKTLIPDLRGCRINALIDESLEMPYLEIVVPNSTLSVHIRANAQTDFDSWYAALMCWKPLKPKGIHNRMAKSQTGVFSGRPLTAESRRNSEMSMLKEAPIIKVGKMIYWDTNVSYSNVGASKSVRPQVHRMQSYGSRWWRRVSCTLRENGELKLYTETENSLVTVVQLSHLSRCAIQRLDPSVLDNEFCIAIHPQYTSTSSTTPSRPVYLSLESRILYEVWFLLLRAFTIPQLYGPRPPTPDGHDDMSTPSDFNALLENSAIDMFRMERALSIRIVEAKLPPSAVVPPSDSTHHSSRSNHSSYKVDHANGYYVEIHLDAETRAKTMVKYEGLYPFWREEFDFLDLPAVLSSASVVLKHRPPDTTTMAERQQARLIHEAYGLIDNGQAGGAASGYTGVSHDQTLGKVEIYLEELEACKEIEKWWPVVNVYGQNVGEILIKARAEENVILMTRDYEPLNQLLHRFGNGLTLQIAQMIPGELRRLSDTLLNIFQVSGQVTEWLMALVEEEIDGIHKETPISRLRYSRRMGSNESEALGSSGVQSDREMIVRDMNKNATLEANLLFRGNTLLTKSLDSHMRRVGKEYLITALGSVIKEINDKDPDCEVDPNKVSDNHVMQRNWHRLLNCTQDVWAAIKGSAKKCPLELRVIFRHIRACAEDRYGDFLRTVMYSSVSGFLFLRFFCPAVLNPKLFGLLKDDPKPRARRTFTLIAKSLQGLANMASFGSKEVWMEPMNAFLSNHRDSFKIFIDDVCSVPAPPNTLPEIPPSYSTPLAIKNRLPLTSREGFPSLPYLIDQAREFAGLVELWLTGTSGGGSSPTGSTNGGQTSTLDERSIAAQIVKEDGDLLAFHNLCTALHTRTQECLSRAERAERPSSSLSFRWEEVIEQLHGSNLDEQHTDSAEATPHTGTPVRNSFDEIAHSAIGPSPALLGSPDLGHGNGGEDDWGRDRDAGAATAAASLTQERTGHRSALSGFRDGAARASNSFDHGSRITAGSSGSGGRDASVAGSVRQDRGLGLSGEALGRRSTDSRDLSGFGNGGKGKETAAPGSGVSSTVSSDTEHAIALPSLLRERERRARAAEKDKDKGRDKDKEKREGKSGLKDFVPSLGMKRRKERRTEAGARFRVQKED